MVAIVVARRASAVICSHDINGLACHRHGFRRPVRPLNPTAETTGAISSTASRGGSRQIG